MSIQPVLDPLAPRFPSARRTGRAAVRAGLLAIVSLLAAGSAAVPTRAQGAREGGQAGPTEKELLAEFGKAFKSSAKVEERVAAITALGDASRELPDGGSSKTLTKALLKGIDDDDLEVQGATIAQLGWGRQPDLVISSLGKYVDAMKKEVEKRITRPDEPSKDYVNRGSRLFGDACDVLSKYPDDRSVDAMGSVMQSLRPNSDGNNLSTRLVGRVAAALLVLGSQDAVKSCVRQTAVYSAEDGFQDSAAKEIHRELSVFATRVGKAPPEFDRNYYVAWDNWFEKWGGEFPKKLGKLKEPPPKPAAAEATEGKPDDGSAAPR